MAALFERLKNMAKIEDSIAYVFQNEGGYGEPPRIDQPTNMGITLVDLLEYRGGENVSVEDLKKLTKMEATEYYRRNYWEPMGLDGLVDQNIATAIFDTGVLHGIHAGVKYAQRVLNILNSPQTVDGIAGPKTISALNAVAREDFIRGYENVVSASYETIIAAKPEDEKYREGWETRAKKLLQLV